MWTLLLWLRNIFWTAPLIFLITAAMGTLSLIVSLFDASGNTQHRLAQSWARMLLWIARVRVTVQGVKNISPGGSYVFVANHSSYFDVPCILPHIPVQLRFLADSGLFGVPFIGYHLQRAGHLPVHGDSARRSLRSMSKAADIIRERGVSVLVFPEGERAYGEVLPFKDGAAFIAIRAGAPIVPIALSGVREVLPRGGMLVRGGEVSLTIGEPIRTLDFSLQDRTPLSQTLRESILRMS